MVKLLCRLRANKVDLYGANRSFFADWASNLFLHTSTQRQTVVTGKKCFALLNYFLHALTPCPSSKRRGEQFAKLQLTEIRPQLMVKLPLITYPLLAAGDPASYKGGVGGLLFCESISANRR
jgi:hypothetical protein